jgi:hypothetical protein
MLHRIPRFLLIATIALPTLLAAGGRPASAQTAVTS